MSGANSNGIIYCWYDSEYSTLDLERAAPIQVGLIVTGVDLIPIEPSPDLFPNAIVMGPGLRIPVSPPEESTPSAWVLNEIASVWDEAISFGHSQGDVDRYHELAVRSASARNGPDVASVVHLAGNSIHHDWLIARSCFPRFSSLLSFQNMDVTAFKLQWRDVRSSGFGQDVHKDDVQWIKEHFPEFIDVPRGRHDAFYDVQASIAELKFYRTFLEPG